MRTILILVLLVTGFGSESFLQASQEMKQIELSAQKLQDFMFGYFLAIGTLEAVPHIQDCLNAVKGLDAKFQQALENLKTKDLEHIVTGIQILANIFNQFANGCGNTTIEGVTAYKNLMATIRAKGFIKQGWVYIGKNLETVVDDVQQYFYNKDDWILKGAYVGDIVRIFVSGKPNDK